MSPMYKISPRAKAAHSWPTSTTAGDVESPLVEGRNKLQAMAWLNSPEGRHFFQQFSSAQQTAWLQKMELKAQLMTIETSGAQSKHSDTAKRWKRESSPKKTNTTVHSSLSSPPKKAGVLLKPLEITAETDSSQQHSSVFNHSPGTSRFVRQARLLNRGSSLIPRPVMESTDPNTIASILRASERRLCVTEMVNA